MGYRSTLTTSSTRFVWPDWIKAKYPGLQFPEAGDSGPISSRCEFKAYQTWCDLPADIQRAIPWADEWQRFDVIYLHESGAVTRIKITRDSIEAFIPTGWQQFEMDDYEVTMGN